MSDVEEPPTKMSKYEEYLEDGDECLEEGQEEWLSEGVLTDDDYHVSMGDHDDSTLGHTNEEDHDTMMSNQDMEVLDQSQDGQTGNDNNDQKIEDTLNNLDGKNGLPEDLDTFLVRKTDIKTMDPKVKDEKELNDVKEDDGNDTDDLLRLLEDGQQAKKKTIKIIKSEKTEENDSTDDDEFIYERSKIKTLKVAKNALIKRIPSKAIPENMSDTDDETDASSDEGATMKKMFGVRGGTSNRTVKFDPPKKVVKHVVQVNTNNTKIDKPKQHFQKSILKPTPTKTKVETRVIKPADIKTPTPFKPMAKKTQQPIKLEAKVEEKKIKIEGGDENNLKTEELDEIIDEEEFLEEDDFELDEEEFGGESDGEDSKKQRIMKPEMMDEEVPSDDDSRSEDGSLYDELPSSDSEDFDDWFTLDVRAERAADYLPLLGACAGALLSAERRRVRGRVATLRHSLSALTDSARRQADALRHAAMALAEIDDTLRAA